jgi:hypothetical protein
MNHTAQNPIPEIDARYRVVTLLYLGKVHEAEVALDGFVKDGTISGKNEAFYRFLLEGAHRCASGLDTSFHDIPSDDQSISSEARHL